MQHGLALERAGKFFLQMGDVDMANSHLNEAMGVYTKWGGTAKVKHLREELTSFIDLGPARA